MMNRLINQFFIFECLVLVVLVSCRDYQNQRTEMMAIPLQGFPQDDGYRLGVSALYCGQLDSMLLVAGGANFPDVSAVEGGRKKYYCSVYVANYSSCSDSLLWKRIGKLPQSAAYGASVQTSKGLLIIGGRNETQVLDRVYMLNLMNDSLKIDTFPPLPNPRFGLSAVLLEHKIYVLGGKIWSNGCLVQTSSLISLDLKDLDKGWINESNFPYSPVTQSVLAAHSDVNEDYLFLMGWFSSATVDSKPLVSSQAWKYIISTKKWVSIADPITSAGDTICFGGGVSYSHNGKIYCSSGVNKIRFYEALMLEYYKLQFVSDSDKYTLDSIRNLQREYMSHIPQWYRFNSCVLAYDIEENKWADILQSPFVSRAGAGLISLNDGFILVNGELKPGIRTPSITLIKLVDKK